MPGGRSFLFRCTNTAHNDLQRARGMSPRHPNTPAHAWRARSLFRPQALPQVSGIETLTTLLAWKSRVGGRITVVRPCKRPPR
jgi:hypothetical protein